MTLPPGTALGPYEVIALLGQGGMGEVYHARDTRLKRTVAIKILAPEIASDPVRRERFEREARAIASLTQPHICAFYDVGEATLSDVAGHDPATCSVPFLVMEYVEGETLAERLAKRPLRRDLLLLRAIEIA